ncbi:hypothetical protein DFJ74DRAFT_658572 [Hyaloraphidium curvatum]|nr:hypothetical protein DFJ74DRAFT_658572 [Hyaloraphidium curvatum]
MRYKLVNNLAYRRLERRLHTRAAGLSVRDLLSTFRESLATGLPAPRLGKGRMALRSTPLQVRRPLPLERPPRPELVEQVVRPYPGPASSFVRFAHGGHRMVPQRLGYPIPRARGPLVHHQRRQPRRAELAPRYRRWPVPRRAARAAVAHAPCRPRTARGRDRAACIRSGGVRRGHSG